MDVNDYIRLELVHEVHTSERRSFRACRRRWDWLFHQRYYPLTTAKPLEFGVAYHKAMETWYDPNTWKWDRSLVADHTLKVFEKECEAQRKVALQTLDVPYMNDEVDQDYADRVELGKGMLFYYMSQVSPKLDYEQSWRPIKVEIGFTVPIRNPETGDEAISCKCNECWEKFQKWDGFKEYIDSSLDLHSFDVSGISGPSQEAILAVARDEWLGLPVVYSGRIDMLAEDKHGRYFVYDWKTAANIPNDHGWLQIDDQIASYCWALRKLGINVVGFVYHEQRKGYPHSPTQNASRRLGRLFSVNKNQDTDYDTYLQTVLLEDNEAYENGLYDEFLEYLKNDGITYYERTQVIKSPQEFDNIERDIGNEVLDMIDPNLRIYPSPGRFGCSFCAFQTPCIEKNTDGDYQYALDTMFEKREHYYVRQRASTESKGGE